MMMMSSSSSSSNGTDRLTLGGYAAHQRAYYALATPAPAAVDGEKFSLGRGYGGGKGQRLIRRSPRMPAGPSSSSLPFSTRVCSFCNKSFLSLQALGEHQVAHRRELEMLRRRRGGDPVAAAGGKAPTAANSQPPPGGRQLEHGGAAPMSLDLTLGCGNSNTEEPVEGSLDLTLRL